jgi:hypothetical protein
MTDPIELPLDDDDRLAEPPLIDSLHYERDADGFSITFVPSQGRDPTRCVFIPRDSAEGRLVAAYLYRVQGLVGSHVLRVVHGGGGDYTLHLPDCTTLKLSEEKWDQGWAPEVFDRLKQIASVAEASLAIHHTQGE